MSWRLPTLHTYTVTIIVSTNVPVQSYKVQRVQDARSMFEALVWQFAYCEALGQYLCKFPFPSLMKSEHQIEP